MTLSGVTSLPGHERLEQGLAVEKMNVSCFGCACGSDSVSGTLCRLVYFHGIVSANVNLCFLRCKAVCIRGYMLLLESNNKWS